VFPTGNRKLLHFTIAKLADYRIIDPHFVPFEPVGITAIAPDFQEGHLSTVAKSFVKK
jgi:hypothetical protein